MSKYLCSMIFSSSKKKSGIVRNISSGKKSLLIFLICIIHAGCKVDFDSPSGCRIFTAPKLGHPGGYKNCVPFDCSKCKYIITNDDEFIDGAALGLMPGDYICFAGDRNTNKNLRFVNIVGAEDNPIIITNCGGTFSVSSPPDSPFTLKFVKSKYFRFTGNGGTDNFGLKISGSTIGMALDYLSTDFEIDHIEVFNVGFAGIMAKTDPSCDTLTQRGNFVMRNVSIHDNFVHEIGGEGFYIGNSFYTDGVKLNACGVAFPHELENIRVYNNHTQNTGREGVQVGCGTKDIEIFNNRVESFGLSYLAGQNNGIQVGDGTTGLCYNNLIFSGDGNGIIVIGIGNNTIFNNIIYKAGAYGIFADDKHARLGGLNFFNNTIVTSDDDGIRLYASGLYRNNIINNLIVGPGSHWNNRYQNSDYAFLFVRDTSELTSASGNLFLDYVYKAQFEDTRNLNFDLGLTSPAVDAGNDISEYGVHFDFRNFPRPIGFGFDVGACEASHPGTKKILLKK